MNIDTNASADNGGNVICDAIVLGVDFLRCIFVEINGQSTVDDCVDCL